MMASSVLSIFLILIPLVGSLVLLWKLVAPLVTVGPRPVPSAWRPTPGGRGRRGRRCTNSRRTRARSGRGRRDRRRPGGRGLPPPPTSPTRACSPDRTPAPGSGWRKLVYRASGRTINPGPSAEERRRAELEARLRTPIEGSRRVVVMSRKGGVGKTTITLALGSIFAMLRGDRVVAVDANPDAGNLAHRVAPPHDRKITDVLHDVDRIDSYARSPRLHLTGPGVEAGGARVGRRPAHRPGTRPGRLPRADHPPRPVLQPDPPRHRHRHPGQREPGPARGGRPAGRGPRSRSRRGPRRGADPGLDGPARLRRPGRPGSRRHQRAASQSATRCTT